MAFCITVLFVKSQSVVQAGFTNFDYQGCVPVKIQFTDSSTGSPTEWYWDFGNGQTSTSSSPSATYTTPGLYTVKMVVRNGVSVDSTSKVIDISGAKADFTYTYSDICKVPAKINFTSLNQRNRVAFHWDFGDTHKSIALNPSNIYSTSGNFKVQLTTISPEGCQDSVIKFIHTGSGTADFNTPSKICENDFATFTDTSRPQALSAVWKINNTVVQQGVGALTYQFTKAGTYNIELAESFGTCQNAIQKSVVVLGKPTAAFSLSGVTKSCGYPDTVRFNNNSANAVAYKWDFGDGGSSTDANPYHVYKAGLFSPVLIAYNANGCADTLVKTNAVFLGGAIINGFNLPDSGCIPFTVHPVANITSPEAITSYQWDFGDGASDANAQPTYTYSKAGRYNVSLTVKTESGCTTTFIIANAVSAGTHSIPDFTASRTDVCGSQNVLFKGTASEPVSYWYWQFSGSSFAFTQNALISYGDTGRRVIKLTVSNSGCLDSVVKRNFIKVNAPISLYHTSYDCNDRTGVSFTDASIDPLSWHWDFGNGSVSDQQNPPAQNYPVSGKYNVSLTTTNGACTNTYTTTISILTSKPVFSYNPPDGHLCRRGNVEVGVTNPSYVIDYLWYLGDGRTVFSDTSITYSYYKTGIYYPSLIARYGSGCQDTLYSPDSILVTGPTANFAAVLPANCLQDTTFFKDYSFSDGEHDIINRVWSYGDAATETDNDFPFQHVYNKSGNYHASLSVADNYNCFDTSYYNITVNDLPPIDAGLDDFVCEGSSIKLKASGAASYIWSEDPSLSCFTCASPDASPVQSATYYVTGTDNNLCKASDTIAVEVVHPFTMTLDNAAKDICATKSIQLNASGADTYSWTPAAGLSSTTIGNPVASPGSPTMYIVTGTDNHSCFSRIDSVLVTVHPNPDVTIPNNPLVVEKGSRNLIATTGSDNIIKWNWYPPTGLSCTNCAQPVVEATKTTTYTAVVYADFGCTDTATIVVHVLCNQSKIFIPTAFTPNGDGRNERFYIQSSTDNPVRSFAIYSRTGELIFSKKNSITNYNADGWDGTYKGVPVPMGTYIYRIEMMCNDAIVPFTGTVTLIR